MLCSTISALSCASSPTRSPPRLELRELRLSETIPGFEYHYEECAKEFLGICTKWEWRTDVYDLRDDAVRLKLRNMGFIARVREKL